MRKIRLLAVATSLFCLSSALAFGQSAPLNGVPLVTQVSPSSLSPATIDPRSGNITLTILGANFPSNAVVNLAGVSSFTLSNSVTQAFAASVNFSGTQIVAQFANPNLVVPSVALVTVTNPNGPQLAVSNPFYLPLSSTLPFFALNPAINSSLNGYANGMTIGDFGRNGNLDLAVVTQLSGTLEILDGNPDGSFSIGTTYPVRNFPSQIVAADFTGSGQLDLAITNPNEKTLTIYLDSSPGTFQPGAVIHLPDVYPTGVVAADFNGDGKIDLAVVNSCGVAPTGCRPNAGPIQVQGTVSILLGNGDGTFTLTPASLSSPTFTGNGPNAIAAADFNGDGFIDLVVTDQGGHELTALMGNGDGTFVPAFNSAVTGAYPSALAVGDFNGDGNIDIAVTNPNDNTVSILLNQNCPAVPSRNCTFVNGPAPPIAVGNRPTAIAIGDMNEDGFLDLVTANAMSNTVSILLGDGTGNFSPVVPQFSPPFSTRQSPTALVLGDFNHNGRLDIATANFSNSYSVLTQAELHRLC